jgi:hypothetical protein
MCDRQNRDLTRQSDENEVVRKIVDRKSAHLRILDTRNGCSALGEQLEVPERLLNLSRKSICYFPVPFSIPGDCLAQFAARPFTDTNGFQRDNTSR